MVVVVVGCHRGVGGGGVGCNVSGGGGVDFGGGGCVGTLFLSSSLVHEVRRLRLGTGGDACTLAAAACFLRNTVIVVCGGE